MRHRWDGFSDFAFAVGADLVTSVAPPTTVASSTPLAPQTESDVLGLSVANPPLVVAGSLSATGSDVGGLLVVSLFADEFRNVFNLSQ